jgi:hypothetical protein
VAVLAIQKGEVGLPALWKPQDRANLFYLRLDLIALSLGQRGEYLKGGGVGREAMEIQASYPWRRGIHISQDFIPYLGFSSLQGEDIQVIGEILSSHELQQTGLRLSIEWSNSDDFPLFADLQNGPFLGLSKMAPPEALPFPGRKRRSGGGLGEEVIPLLRGEKGQLGRCRDEL